MYTDPSTNITFPTWTDGAGYTFGLVVPDTALTTDSYEYIGYLVRFCTMQLMRILHANQEPELHNPIRSRCSILRPVPRPIRSDGAGTSSHGMAL